MDACTPLTDAHFHMCESGFPGEYPDIGSVVRAVSCTSGPEEWEAQASVSAEGTVPSFGVHPWNCGCWNISVRERLLSMLEGDRSAQVGEIGLDSARGGLSEQMAAFAGQLDVALLADRAVSIHMVGAEKQVLDALRPSARSRRVILHSFSSESYVKPFSEIGCFFSVSPRILARSGERVARLLRSIPSDRLLLESDAPHQGRLFTGMGDFAGTVAGILGCAPEEMAGRLYDNLGRAIG